MNNNKRTPQIRFAGFTDDWEQRKLGDLADIRRGLTYSPNDIKNEGIRVLRSSNINEDIFCENKDDVFVDQKAINIPFAKTGDILITAANGSTRLVGKHAIIRLNQNDKVVHGGFMLLARTKNPYFLNASMSSSWYTNFISTYVAGGNGAIGNLSKSDLDNRLILMPNEEEQTAIGNFFKQLDETIALHQRECEKYKNLKKSYLEKMFPKENEQFPELRFPEFTDAWEQRKLGEIYGKIRNAFVGTATPYYVEQGYFYLESNNVKNGQINRNSEIFINEAFYYAQRDKWLKENDLVMVQSGHVGHTAVIPKELDNTAAHALITFSDYKEDTDPHFLNYFFQTTLAKLGIEKITTGNTIKHILSSDMKGFQIKLPKFEEQTAIGNFFRQLDETIALHQRKAEKFKQIKQFYLEKMFV